MAPSLDECPHWKLPFALYLFVSVLLEVFKLISKGMSTLPLKIIIMRNSYDAKNNACMVVLLRAPGYL